MYFALCSLGLLWPHQVWPPTPFLLAGRVDLGPSVHASREHGFRLTVPDGSLPRPIGPITVQDTARVVKCENDSDSYLVTTVANCQPAGIRFSVKPLFMDFLVEDTSNGDIPDIPNADDADTANDVMSETPNDGNSETSNDSMSETSDGDISETFQVCKTMRGVVDLLTIVLADALHHTALAGTIIRVWYSYQIPESKREFYSRPGIIV